LIIWLGSRNFKVDFGLNNKIKAAKYVDNYSINYLLYDSSKYTNIFRAAIFFRYWVIMIGLLIFSNDLEYNSLGFENVFENVIK
jgi:hypothetical protein